MLNRGFNKGTSKSEKVSAMTLAGARIVNLPHMHLLGQDRVAANLKY